MCYPEQEDERRQERIKQQEDERRSIVAHLTELKAQKAAAFELAQAKVCHYIDHGQRCLDTTC